jgi:threonine dehydratase
LALARERRRYESNWLESVRAVGGLSFRRLAQDTIFLVGGFPHGFTARDVPLAAVEAAARAIYNPVVRTPLVRLPLPSGAALREAEIFLKLETLQPVGSFKIRGAWNVIRQAPRSSLADGVWTVSAGNAAQGVALAARVAGCPAR